MKEFLWFFVASAAGLTIDLLGFFAMNLAGFEPWIANATSSTASITVVYLVATRKSFQVGTGWKTYLAFFSWYALSIASFSALIQYFVEVTDLHSFSLKLMTVPVSFGLNYLFSKILFGRKKSRDG